MNTIKRIIHLADIHIRLYKRHQEYREVFETLYAELRAQDLTDTVIVVAGDIVHSKTDLSPEMVDLASGFLSNLSALAPTIVIAGNHDMNVANPNRLDALTPIVANINNANLHYYKNSGVYRLGDIDFAVHSIIGEQSDWPTPSECSAQTKIALFHGPIHNAKTDQGFTITNRHVNIETFDGYDMVLLGDIHRHQTLQSYDPGAKRPIIVYPGSLVQQNHGETLKGHGWCEWDIASRSFKFRELKNKYGYYTLTVENGRVPSYSDMPEKVRLRIFAGSMDQAAIKRLVADIRSQRTVSELNVSTFTGGKTSQVGVANKFLDIHDVTVQNKLLSDFINNVYPETSQDTLDRVFDLNKRLNEEVVTDDPTRKLVWRPLTLQYDNLFTYGEKNFINFADMKGVVGIFAPNASGKTSIPDALCFALYDRTPRTQKAANIMNTQRDKCYCKLVFEVDGNQYVIERKGTRNKKGEVKIDVEFYRVNGDGSTTSLNGEERRYTNANIRSYVGDYEDFVLTAFSTQSQNSLFVDRGQSDRKDLLSQFMGLNIFDKLHTIANDESKEVAGALKRFKNDDFTQELVDVTSDIHQQEALVETAEKMLEEVNSTLNKCTDEIQKYIAQKLPIKKFQDIVILEATKKRILADMEDKVIEYDSLAIHIKNLEAKVLEGLGKLSTEYVDTEERYNKLQALKARQDAYMQFVNPLITKRDELERQLKDLEQHQYDPNCIFCVTNGKHNIESREEIKRRIEEVITMLNARYEQDKGIWDDAVSNYKGVEEKYDKLLAGREWVQRQQQARDRAELQSSKLQIEIEKQRNVLQSVEREITEYLAAQEAIVANRRADENIKYWEDAKLQHKKRFNERTQVVQSSKTKLALLEKRKQDMLDKIKEAEDLENKYEAYEVYLKTVSRDGLPYRLISEVLPNVQTEVNSILSQMVEFTLLFETDGKNINMKICYDDARVWPLELASGMEKFITGLAIRVALMTVSSLPKSNFLIIDEGLGTLDPENLSSIFSLFDVLKTHFDFILMISHVDAVRDISDSLVEIDRKDGFSRVEVL